MNALYNGLSRRSLVAASAWSVPAVALAAAAPAVSASLRDSGYGLDYGLYVSAQSASGLIGYGAGSNTGNKFPQSPQGYFAAKKAGQNISSDLNWVDDGRGGGRRTHQSLYVNGQGDFPPVSNSSTGSGAYTSTSGFWFSVPTASSGTGSYISGVRPL